MNDFYDDIKIYSQNGKEQELFNCFFKYAKYRKCDKTSCILETFPIEYLDKIEKYCELFNNDKIDNFLKEKGVEVLGLISFCQCIENNASNPPITLNHNNTYFKFNNTGIKKEELLEYFSIFRAINIMVILKKLGFIDFKPNGLNDDEMEMKLLGDIKKKDKKTIIKFFNGVELREWEEELG